MKPSEILDSAANIILRDGWHRGQYFQPPDSPGYGDGYLAVEDEANRTAPCCQEGAISRAIYGYAWVNGRVTPNRSQEEAEAMRGARTYMRRYVDAHHGVGSAIVWNDEPSTTREDVVEALRGAAEAARGDGQ